MKASDYIAQFLHLKGVTHVFELSGGMITHLLDSISQTTPIKIITMHHEQSAAFAADAYGRMTGIPGVALATSGPGATNLLTGIGSCYFDSSPAVFITGQVNTHELKSDRPIRQLGFQETDIVAMAQPITKACFQVLDPLQIPDIMEQAFAIATSGRPGPVLIDIPMNIQRGDVPTLPNPIATIKNTTAFTDTLFESLLSDIKAAKRPLILVGRGIDAAGARKELLELVDKLQVPVVTSLLGLDLLHFDHPLRAGFIGSYGNRWANIAFGESDLIVVIGCRLDIRQTGADTKYFENRIIYHVDCEEGEINNRIKNCIPVVGDAKAFICALLNSSILEKEQPLQRKAEWIDYIAALKEKWPDTAELNPVGINPNKFMHQLSRRSVSAKAFLADVGAHQMWAAQSLELGKDQIFMTSGGMGAMGFSLPAGIGASIAAGNSPVVVLVGDGSMQINIQELQTIVRNDLPVKVIVLNNRHLGMIRQFQDSYFDSRYQSTYWGYSAPDFEKVATAYGIAAKTIENESDMEEAVEWMWSKEQQDKPVLLQVMIDPKTNTYPKIAFGKPITEMEPFSKPIEMEGT
ncbi:MAG: thiamine pyrophosphate-binding protein [Chitinophaga sp.]|uniref:thiamine pyrophosphate-binding protein n=1 Tax=Chitinophaga sp. TaxID=1869181 RepID=UPI0025BC6170|nr:thiamine pyrophosphate-binding protein [Chitinophaga sp.]MBV8254356.1 thiamine pyrophosphate-binding protein [Chitinophaga sp.]